LDSLQPEKDKKFCRLGVADSKLLQPNQEVDVKVTVQRRAPSDQPKDLFVEACALLGRPYVFRGRGLMPARFTDGHIRLLNTSGAVCQLKRGSNLGGTCQVVNRRTPRVTSIQTGDRASSEEVTQHNKC